LDSFCRFVDSINERTGRIVAWLFIPLTLLVVTDVFTRYVLDKPWYYLDINVQIMGILTVLGAGYCYLHGGHVSVDILVTRLSARKRAILDVILFPLVLGALGPLLWKVTEGTIQSVQMLQVYKSVITIPLYPYKVLVTAGICLMLLQGISKFIGNLRIVFPARPGGKP